jgi:tetratricopeptide (TPR) repeat protein
MRIKNTFCFHAILVLCMSFGIGFLSASSLATNGETNSLQTFEYNKQAENLMKEKEPKFLEAMDLILKALAKDPYSPELHMNLGLAIEGLGQLDKAISSYKTAEKLTSRDDIKFLSLYNQAQAQAKLKKIDEALGNYQKALNYNPSSAEVKTNIELLMQKQQKGGSGGDGDKDEEQKKEGKDDKEGQGDKDKKNEKEPQHFAENPKPEKGKPQRFESKELGENDARKILEDIKSQEQRIRQDYDKQGKTRESVRGKDW